ncbi:MULTISPECIES: ribbon-helix-helix protein, CopG family [unclassified Moorena]|uniref:Ribbon-helix-helix protein CopG domain-containing protein n=1 Tax=Moorena producens 3L TaxID=489825 RepID=F4XR14_9CYAN|nr:hypothetical protein LYNGBM3L_55700 [Moorena producens 3L]NEP33907.1 ribbon-helix-helix protein, CopG family [Moorena sp. SIO3B2]NEP68419.1 ribbon-helix-helix protein, CopG family [Moorena sp. SIO3A5]NEQ07544.1 ribbon-helix-helix protein, CopG family [Moorena sp. SIO4E2]NEQ12545.1 ribbon-helix-helix protein, CopG family [Moorena sp. SIO3E2]NER91072.1 ribbon-helix-helix protein, CopG family [Moorena sp. SIO3A2]NES43758.1 ribbon-helix-helix protein, CopG family [Moorena sp. SIO2C4]NET69061.
MLTPSSIKKLDKLAKRLKSSRSELVEQFARSQDNPSLVARHKCWRRTPIGNLILNGKSAPRVFLTQRSNQVGIPRQKRK